MLKRCNNKQTRATPLAEAVSYTVSPQSFWDTLEGGNDPQSDGNTHAGSDTDITETAHQSK